MDKKQPGFLPTLVQSNKITTARYSYTALQKRCIYAIISEVRRIYLDSNLHPGEAVQLDMFRDMELTFPAGLLQKLGEQEKEVRNAFRGLAGRLIEIDKEDGTWEMMTWVFSVKSNRDKSVTARVAKELLPYIVDLASHFTEYAMVVAMSLKSVYSQRFYELCNQYREKGGFFLEVDALRKMMMLEDKKSYENYGEIRRSIIDVAHDELKLMYELGQSDLYFEYREKDKDGKKVLSLWFTIVDRERQKELQLDYTRLFSEVRRILERSYKRDGKFVERAMISLKLDPDKARRFLDRCYKVEEEYELKEIPAVLRYILRQDYDIK